LESTNFSLNDDEFSKIKEISKNIDNQVLILFWQFTIRTIEELDLVSNQNLSIEMFLMRLMYIISLKPEKKDFKKNEELISVKDDLTSDDGNNFKTEPINQIKNIAQEKKLKPEMQAEIKSNQENKIDSFEELLKICGEKKEIKLKYELEKNVNLVSFERQRIEISFNDNLDKNFVKDLSSKLLEWTNERWIISFSKKQGDKSIKDKKKNEQKELIENTKKSDLFKIMKNYFSDAELIEIDKEQKDYD